MTLRMRVRVHFRAWTRVRVTQRRIQMVTGHLFRGNALQVYVLWTSLGKKRMEGERIPNKLRCVLSLSSPLSLFLG